MGVSGGVVWSVPPSQLAKAVQRYGDRVYVAIKALADYIAQKLQDDARRDAPWQDRTGNARGGLFGIAEQTARDMVTIYLSHTMSYGVFLELANGGRWAIIMPTIERNLPEIETMLKRLLKG